MPLEPGVTIHTDAMASHFGQKKKKTKQQKQKPQTHPTASEHPGSTLPGPMFFLKKKKRSNGTLFTGGGSLSFATQDCTLVKMTWGPFPVGVAVCRSRLKIAPNWKCRLSPCVFFWGGGRRHPTKGSRVTNAPRAWDSWALTQCHDLIRVTDREITRDRMNYLCSLAAWTILDSNAGIKRLVRSGSWLANCRRINSFIGAKSSLWAGVTV